MGLENVREEVISKARKQASAMVAEAKKEADAIVSAAEEKALARRKIILDETEKELADQKAREMASAELDVTKMLLEAKKRIIEAVFQDAMDSVSKTPPQKRKEHINAIVSRAKKEIEIHRLLCNEKDIKHISGFRVQPLDIAGGVIAENKDGTIRIDYSYEAQLEKIREGTLKDVAKILFKGE